MKFLHLSDLHIGRMLHRYSLQEEQSRMLESLLAIAADEMPDAVLIAGDVYDRSIPPVYATQMLDSFLGKLSKIAPVFVISGNHDQAERLAFLSEPLQACGIYLSPAYRGTVEPVTLRDNAGEVDIWLLPFVKAATVRPYFPEDTFESTHDAVTCAIGQMSIDPKRRNVLVAHQFVAGSMASGSEETVFTLDISVGGSDLVGAEAFAAFDYVALGHIHRAQNVGERIRYCGTPMAYDFSETNHQKSVTVAELDGNRKLTIRTVPVPAPRKLAEVRGTFAEITSEEAICSANKDAYTRVILTDDAIIPDVMNRLRQVYPLLTHLDWDNARMQHQADVSLPTDAKKHTPSSLFEEFYQHMGGTELSGEQKEYLDRVIGEIWGGLA